MDRINIIDELTNLYIKDAESCNDILDSLGYYEQLENYRPSKKLFPWEKKENANPFESIPLCWQGPFSFGGTMTWVMIAGFGILENQLYAEIYNYHSGPPDYMYINIDSVPDVVLSSALILLQDERNIHLAKCRKDLIQWLSELPHSKKESVDFLIGRGLSKEDAIQIVENLSEFPSFS